MYLTIKHVHYLAMQMYLNADEPLLLHATILVCNADVTDGEACLTFLRKESHKSTFVFFPH